jgi:PucR family transcriptional regulator, purine catabolism regulatory protein
MVVHTWIQGSFGGLIEPESFLISNRLTLLAESEPEPRLAQAPVRSTEFADFGLTVAECLALSPLTKGSVVGGHAGLLRRARWVHVVDHDDIEDSLTGAELILSSGVSLAYSASLQRSIFPIMERRASAGLILALGAHIREVPEAMLNEANRFGIPLITMPWEVNFRDITQVLLTRIVREQYRLLEDAESINRSLFQIAVNRGSLQDLCNRLVELTGHCSAIIDPSYRLVIRSAGTPCDPLFPNVFLGNPGECPPKPQIENLGTASGRWAIKAPIFITSRLHGHLVVDTGQDKAGRFEGMVVEAATLVAALIIAQTEEIDRIRASRERDSLVSLIEGHQTPAKIAALGPLPQGPYRLMVLEIEGGVAEMDRRLIRRTIDPLVPHARISEYANQFVVLLPRIRHNSQRATAETLLKGLENAACGARIGVSSPFAALVDLHKGYAEAQETIAVGRAVNPSGRLFFAEDSGALRRFAKSLDGRVGAEGGGRLQCLITHDASHRSDLVRTLDCFLAANQNLATAARQLDIHRHTLAYRLERIIELLGTPLTPEVSLDLRLALVANRLAAPA